MSKIEVQEFETRPKKVNAVFWDGSKKSAKKIVEWLATFGATGYWSESYRGNTKGDVIVPESDVVFSVDYKMRSRNLLGPLPVNTWIVLHEEGLDAISAADFSNEYREVTI